jgi:hypothetical protein
MLQLTDKVEVATIMARQRAKVISKPSLALTGPAASAPLAKPVSADSSAISVLAYQLWQRRGCPEGSPETDWLQAERELSSQLVKPKSLSTKRHLLARKAGA